MASIPGFTNATNGADISSGDLDKPVIILLHGLGGNLTHMSAPASLGFNYNFAGAPPANVPLGTFSNPPLTLHAPVAPVPDLFMAVTGWRPFLSAAGFRTVIYTQASPGGALAAAITQLRSLILALETFPGIGPDTKYILLAHSRGGILARAFLKANAGTPSVVGRISKVITLCSPHTGSAWVGALAADAALLTTLIGLLPPALGPAATTALAPVLGFLGGGAGRAELAVGGPFLTALAAGETPLPGIDYHTFGGTSIRATRIWEWFHALSSWAPIIAGFPFATTVSFVHTATPSESPAASPLCERLRLVLPLQYRLPEITTGSGDILVSDARASLPFGAHQTFPINHAEALWDPALQAAVLDLLVEGTWRSWGIFRGAGTDGRPLLVRDESSRLALFSDTGATLRQKVELAAGDPVPSGTTPVAPDEAHGWTNWSELPTFFGYRQLRAAIDSVAINGRAQPGLLHLFALAGPSYDPTEENPGGYGSPAGTDNVYERSRRTSAFDWSSWTDRGGTVFAQEQGSPFVHAASGLFGGLAVTRNGQGFIEVFARGTGRQWDKPDIWHMAQTVPATAGQIPGWSAWTSLGLPCAGDPAAALNELGQVELYLPDADGVVHLYRRLAPDRGFAEWSFAEEAMAGDVTVIADGAGVQTVLARGNDGLLYWTRQKKSLRSLLPNPRLVARARNEFLRGELRATALLQLADVLGDANTIRGKGAWNEWIPESGAIRFGSLTAAQTGDGRIEVFATTADGLVVGKLQTAAGARTWTSWRTLGGVAKGRIAASARADGRMVVAATGEDGVLRQRVQSSPGIW